MNCGELAEAERRIDAWARRYLYKKRDRHWPGSYRVTPKNCKVLKLSPSGLAKEQQKEQQNEQHAQEGKSARTAKLERVNPSTQRILPGF